MVRPVRMRVPAATATTLVTVAAVVGYAAAAGLARPFSWPADAFAGLAGAGVLLSAAPWRAPRGSPAAVGAGAWLLPLAVLTAVELTELFAHPRASHPTLTSLAAPLLAHWAGRSAAYAAWLTLGLALRRR